MKSTFTKTQEGKLREERPQFFEHDPVLLLEERERILKEQENTINSIDARVAVIDSILEKGRQLSAKGFEEEKVIERDNKAAMS